MSLIIDIKQYQMFRASSPGKVLICGGYLVVEAPNIGISLGVSARFTTEMVECSQSESKGESVVEVLSPQFGTSFKFIVSGEGALFRVSQTEGPNSPFLHFAIMYSFAHAHNKGANFMGQSVVLRLLASNDFYSQRNYLEQLGKTVSVENLRTVPPHQTLVGNVSKTGLGSSAAMTTSVVACLLSKLLAEDNRRDLVEEIHRVAQVAHCGAQGKIGSGFDVYTATYGTSIYSRFDPKLIEGLIGNIVQVADASLLKQCIDPSVSWVTHRTFDGLPKGVHLILGDVHQGGSSTPGMVSKIMNWRKGVASEKDNLWEQLTKANEEYIELLTDLRKMSVSVTDEYLVALAEAGQTCPIQWSSSNSASSLLCKVRDAANNCRTLLRQVGEAADVGVEPHELSPLLNSTSSLAGVLAVGCPGAGGYDAVFALCVGEESRSKVEAYWESSPEGLNVCPLLVEEDNRGIMFE